MRGKALLTFLIFGSLTVVAVGMHQKNPEEIGLAPALVLGAVAVLSLSVAVFLKAGLNAAVNAAQRRRDRDGLSNVCAACGHDGTRKNPLTLSDDGYRICTSHVLDPDGPWS
jgi:hypothetical protein